MLFQTSQAALVVKNLPANAGDLRDTRLIPGSGRFPGEGNVKDSSILAWRRPCTEEPVGYSPWGLAKTQTQLKRLSKQAHTPTVLSFYQKKKKRSGRIRLLSAVFFTLFLSLKKYHIHISKTEHVTHFYQLHIHPLCGASNFIYFLPQWQSFWFVLLLYSLIFLPSYWVFLRKPSNKYTSISAVKSPRNATAGS